MKDNENIVAKNNPTLPKLVLPKKKNIIRIRTSMKKKIVYAI
jgi:hypothetical protein